MKDEQLLQRIVLNPKIHETLISIYQKEEGKDFSPIILGGGWYEDHATGFH